MRGVIRLVATAAVLLAACTPGNGPGESTGPEPPVRVEQPPAPEPDVPEGDAPRVPEDELEPTYVELSADAVDVVAQDWTEVFVLDGGRTLELRWWGGVAPCHVPAGVDVDYREDVVEVGLRVGSAPAEGGEQRACPAIAQYTALRVPLDEPVGQRSILDATG